MKKTLKILAGSVGGLIVLLIILAVGLAFFIDPNQYKEKIIEAVKAKTGRELRIEGKLGWSFFPWVGIETGALQLSNAPGFGAEPFARIDGAGAKVELLPLLRKQVVIDTVFLDGLKLNLAKNAAGKTNWDDLTTPSPVEKTAEKTEPSAKPGIAGISVNKLDIRKADIVWKDEASGARYALHNLELKTGKIVLGSPVDLHLAFDLESGNPPLRSRVELKSQIGLDLNTQALDITNLSLTLAGLSLAANIQGRKIFDAPAFDGTLDVASFNPRALMDKLGVKYETGDKKALEKLSLKTKFSATADSVELKELALNLDETQVSGTLALQHFAKPVYRFDLALDQIDVDRYLPPPAPAVASESKSGAAAAPTPSAAAPLAALRTLTAQGKLRIQKFKAMNLHANDVAIQIAADNGVMTLGPNQAKLYNGKYTGRSTLDMRGKIPLLSLDESLSGIESAPLLKDALQFEKFAGAANITAKLTAQGLDARQIKESLTGSASFSVDNGIVKGIDLKKMSDTIETAKREKAFQKLSELKPEPSDETRFSQMSGTAQIKNGLVQNNDLKVQIPNLLNVSGKGSADLPQEILNYTLTIGSVPLLIEGPFSRPRFKPDWNTILQGRLEEKKSQAIEKLEERKSEIAEKFGQKLKERFNLRK